MFEDREDADQHPPCLWSLRAAGPTAEETTVQTRYPSALTHVHHFPTVTLKAVTKQLLGQRSRCQAAKASCFVDKVIY